MNGRLRYMAEETQFAVIQLPELSWPISTALPSSRFRLFVAADTSAVTTDAISRFASAALSEGMVYFCAWGRGCERFHDIVDQVRAEDELTEGRFIGPTEHDVVMTTWHDNETLEQALDFFITCAVPTDGFAIDSSFRLVVCIGNPDWSEIAIRVLQTTPLT